MTKENWRSKILCAYASGSGCGSAPDTAGGSEGAVLGVDGKTRESEHVSRTPATMTRDENLRAVIALGDVRLRDPADKHVRIRKKFKVCICSSFSHKDMLLVFV